MFLLLLVGARALSCTDASNLWSQECCSGGSINCAFQNDENGVVIPSTNNTIGNGLRSVIIGSANTVYDTNELRWRKNTGYASGVTVVAKTWTSDADRHVNYDSSITGDSWEYKVGGTTCAYADDFEQHSWGKPYYQFHEETATSCYNLCSNVLSTAAPRAYNYVAAIRYRKCGQLTSAGGCNSAGNPEWRCRCVRDTGSVACSLFDGTATTRPHDTWFEEVSGLYTAARFVVTWGTNRGGFNLLTSADWTTNYDGSVALGNHNAVLGDRGVALGTRNLVYSLQSVDPGGTSEIGAQDFETTPLENGVAIGEGNVVACSHCVALGYHAYASTGAGSTFVYHADTNSVPGQGGDELSTGNRRLSETRVPRGSVTVGGVLVAEEALVEKVSTSSDRRVKRDIVAADTAALLANINALRLRHYGYTDAFLAHTQRDDTENYGFIAQEVETVMPTAVKTSRKKLIQYNPHSERHEVLEDIVDFKSLNKDIIFTQAIGAIQELSRRLELLE